MRALRALDDKPAHPAHHDHQAHPGDPVKQEEHSAMFELVSDRDASHRAVADGAWGDPKTWDKGSVPGAGARIVIPAERSVTVAARHDQSASTGSASMARCASIPGPRRA